jgi:hypothetical protein
MRRTIDPDTLRCNFCDMQQTNRPNLNWHQQHCVHNPANKDKPFWSLDVVKHLVLTPGGAEAMITKMDRRAGLVQVQVMGSQPTWWRVEELRRLTE